MKRALRLAAPFVLLAACAEPPPPVTPLPPPPEAPTTATPPPAPPPPKLDSVARLDFNRIAAELDLPLFWIADANNNATVDPDEVAGLWGAAPPPAWVESGAFSPKFVEAFTRIAKVAKDGHDFSALPEAEQRRRKAVIAELAQGRPSLVRSDFRSAPAEDRALVDHILRAAAIIERIFARQGGTLGLEAQIPADDAASRRLFFRNQGPWCEQPKTEKDPDCNALAARPPRVVGLYPAGVQKDKGFCKALEARKDAKELLTPFTVVTETGGDFKAVPYSVAYKEDMEAVSRELKAAADAVTSPDEAKLKAYLLAASQSFLTNDWNPADEAWSRMSVDNSKWYLRIGPDEVQHDPCSQKGGFHVSFARINKDSLRWQKMLDPHKTEMEEALAKLAGPPYKAHKVTFHLPDFIDIVLNAGDSRSATGATIGQSLPNWGPVANEGRGRTVAMTNLYTDKDSEQAFNDSVKALYCKASVPLATFSPDLVVMSTVLHEAAHNLGPAHEYKVKGKKDTEVFGGQLAGTLEELKAQSSALFLADWLAEKKLIDTKTRNLAHVRDVSWAFGHIAAGMYTADGVRKPYSQLASIQVGTLLREGALEWKAEELAGNGKDKGCFEVHIEKFPRIIRKIEKQVLEIKGKGDKAAALKLMDEFVDDKGDWKKLREIIQERWLRAPKASFVYAVDR